MLHSKWFLAKFTLRLIFVTKYRATMQQNNKNMMIVDSLEYENMCAKAAKYDKNRKLNNGYVKNNREKKQKLLEEENNKPVLRHIPTVNHVDVVVGDELERISKLGINERIIEVDTKFRTIQKYKMKDTYIIQMRHNKHWIDWLKVVKPSVDEKGYGLFAMQDISSYKLVTLYLGDFFTEKEEEDWKKTKGQEKYTLESNVTYDDRYGWKTNKKRKMYVVPKMKRNKWKPVVDDMYIGGHLINDFHHTHRKSANVAFSYFFQIYSIKEIKAGDELLVNYHIRAKQSLGELSKN